MAWANLRRKPHTCEVRLATVYSTTNTGLERAPNLGHMVGQSAYVDGPRTSFPGSAGLLSTATDYARFLQMMLTGGELEGTRLLSRKMVKLMTIGSWSTLRS